MPSRFKKVETRSVGTADNGSRFRLAGYLRFDIKTVAFLYQPVTSDG